VIEGGGSGAIERIMPAWRVPVTESAVSAVVVGGHALSSSSVICIGVVREGV
jgi:hypothetical protein